MENKNTNLGYKVTIILLLLIIAFFIFDKMKTSKLQKETQEQVIVTTNEKDSLQNELQNLYDTYNSLKTNNEVINDSLLAQKQKVEKLITQLKNTKSTDTYKIKQLKNEVETLKKIMKSYVKQIDSLYTQNKILITKNTEIKTQYTEVISENQELTQKKDSLEQTVKVAQKLSTYSIQFEGINKRGKTTERIKKINRFRVCFTLSENEITTKGRKNIYLRVTKPGGDVLRNSNSGFFNFKGESIAYSSVKEIEYNGNQQDICMFYILESENDLPKGKYTIFLFADGYQIGDYSIVLK